MFFHCPMLLKGQKVSFDDLWFTSNVWLSVTETAGLQIVTDMVTNATNIFSLVTKNSGLVATLVTRFLYDLDLIIFQRVKLKQTFHLILLCFRHKKCAKLHKQSQVTSTFILTYLSAIISNNQIWWIALYYRASDRLRKKSQVLRDFHRQIHGASFSEKQSVKSGRCYGNFLGKFH